VVINDDAKMIRGKSVRLEEHLIVYKFIFKCYLTTDKIIEGCRSFFGYLEPDCMLFSFLNSKL